MIALSRPVPIVLAASVLAALTAFLLRQSPSQRFEAELADLSPEMALVRLAEADAKGALDDVVRVRFGELALQAGDVDTARKVFESLKARPRLGKEAELRLAVIAWLDGDLKTAADHLATAYLAQPDADIRQQLGGWYRQLRDVDGELGVLESVGAQQLTPWEAGRLAELLGLRGRQDEVRALLMKLADGAADDRTVWRQRLIDFLIDAGEPAAALELARGWIAADPEGSGLELAVAAFLDRGAVGEAMGLAAEALARRPSTAHPVLIVFAQRGYSGLAIALGSHWLDRARTLDAGAWATLTTISARTGDLLQMRRALAGARAGETEPTSLASALEQVLRYGGPRAIVPHRRLLTSAVTDASPLLAAAIAAEAGMLRPLYAALVLASAKPMEDWQAEVWLSLSLRLRGTEAWRLLYLEMPPESRPRQMLSSLVIAELSELQTQTQP